MSEQKINLTGQGRVMLAGRLSLIQILTLFGFFGYSHFLQAQETSLPTPVAQNQVRYLPHSDQAFAHFVALVQSAQKTIDIATFIFEPCHTSTQVLLDEIQKKASQGVKIRILLDAISQKAAQQKVLADYFSRNQIQFALFNPTKSPAANFRLHSKMLIVDGRRVIAGGRNLSDSYFGLDSEYNFIDEDFMITGAVAAEAQNQFNKLWKAELTKKRVGNKQIEINWALICQNQSKVSFSRLKDFLYRNTSKLISSTQAHDCEKANIYTDDPEFSNPKYGESRLEGDATPAYMTAQRLELKKTSTAMLNFLKKAQNNLRVQNWVYLPIWELDDAFEGLRKKKIDVEVLTNQDIEGDKETFRNMMEAAQSAIASRDHKGSQRVRLVSSYGGLRDDFELTPKSVRFFIHGKSMVRDHRDVFVGSFNLDSRSFNTNVESGTIVESCPTLTAEVLNRHRQIKNIYKRDVASESLPEKPKPGYWARFLALLSLALL